MVNAALLPPASVSSSHDSISRTSATLPGGKGQGSRRVMSSLKELENSQGSRRVMSSLQELESSQNEVQRTRTSDDIATQDDVPWVSG